MINGIVNSLNTRLRLSGLSSGLDTDTIIKQMLVGEQSKIDKVRQNIQLTQWRMEAYRSVTNTLRSFSDTYFNVLKPSTYLLSKTNFSAYSVTGGAGSSSVVTAVAAGGAQDMTHTISVAALATASYISGNSPVVDTITGSNDITNFNLQGKQLRITLDGTSKTFDLHDFTGGMDEVVSYLKTSAATAFGSGKIDVVANGNKLQIKTVLSGSTISISEPSNNFISALGFANGQQNYVTGGADVSTPYSGFTNGTFQIALGTNDAQTITIDGAADIDELTSKLNAAVNGIPELSGKITFSNDGSRMTVLNSSGESITLKSGSTNNILGKLGFSSGTVINNTSSAAINLSGNEKGKSFIVNINGVDKLVTLGQDYSDLDEMAADIQSQLTGVTVTKDADSNKLKFSSTEKIILKKGPDDSLASLGYSSTDNKSNKIDLSASLNTIKTNFATDLNVADPNANVSFVINGVTIDLKKSYAQATLNDVMSAINASSAGVQLSYDSLNDKFTLKSKTTGAAQSITYTDTDATNGILKAIGIAGNAVIEGTDAKFTLDGVADMVRSSNTFTVDGVTYTLKGTSEAPVTIDVKADVDSLVNKIKDFVEKYNALLDAVNTQIYDKRPRSGGDSGTYYLPLTAEQKSAMTESDITEWEKNAKTGLLNNDSILQNMVSSMRSAIMDKVEGTSVSLYSLGITTGSYFERGKLVIDEAKLKNAITSNPDAVAKLFTNSSQYSYSQAMDSSSAKAVRYSESGIAQRLNDILQDNIRITRNSAGQKGILLEKAGIEKDTTEYTSLLAHELTDQNDYVGTLVDKMYEKQEAYYLKFSAMETALSRMNAQSSWLTQMFNSGG